MGNTRIELTLERESGLTENAIESQMKELFGDDLVTVEVNKQ